MPPNADRTARARHGNRARGSATRQEILTRAIDLIARRGARGVSLGEIAEAAGVSKAGLMHHFPNKDALLNAALDVRDALDHHTRPGRSVVGVEVFEEVEHIVQGWHEQPATLGLFTELLAENLTDDDPLHARLVERAASVHANLARSLDLGVRRGDIRPDVDVDLVAHLVIAFVNGLETYWQLDSRIPAAEMAASWRQAMVRSFGSHDAQLAGESARGASAVTA